MGCCDSCQTLQVPMGNMGVAGANGLNGVFGGNSDKFLFSTSTSGNPGFSQLLFDNANIAAATHINVSDHDFYSVNVAAWLDALGATSDSTIKGYLRVFNELDPSKFAIYQVTGQNNFPPDYIQFVISYLTGSGTTPFATGDPIIFSYDTTGNDGINGTNGTNSSVTLFNNISQTASGNTSAGLLLQQTNVIPSGTLANNGDSIYMEAVFNNQSTVFNPIVENEIRVGGFTVIQNIMSSPQGSVEIVEITIERISATSLLLTTSARYRNINLLVTPTVQTVTVPDVTANPVNVTWYALTNNANQNIVCNKFFGEYKPI